MRLILCLLLALSSQSFASDPLYPSEGKVLLKSFLPMVEAIDAAVTKNGRSSSPYYSAVENRFGIFSKSLMGPGLSPSEKYAYKTTKSHPKPTKSEAIDNDTFHDLFERLNENKNWKKNTCRDFLYGVANKARASLFSTTQVDLFVLGKYYRLNISPDQVFNYLGDLDPKETVQFYDSLYRRVFTKPPFSVIDFNWPKDLKVQYLSLALDAIVQILIRELFLGKEKLKACHRVGIHSGGRDLTLTLNPAFIAEVKQVQTLRETLFNFETNSNRFSQNDLDEAKGLLFASAISHFWGINPDAQEKPHRTLFSIGMEKNSSKAQGKVVAAHTILEHLLTTDKLSSAKSLFNFMLKFVHNFDEVSRRSWPDDYPEITSPKKPDALALINEIFPASPTKPFTEAELSIEKTVSKKTKKIRSHSANAKKPIKPPFDSTEQAIKDFLKLKDEYEHRVKNGVSGNNIKGLLNDFIFLTSLKSEILAANVEPFADADFAAGPVYSSSSDFFELETWNHNDFVPLSRLVKEYEASLMKDRPHTKAIKGEISSLIEVLACSSKPLPECVQPFVDKYRKAKDSEEITAKEAKAIQERLTQETKKAKAVQERLAQETKEAKALQESLAKEARNAKALQESLAKEAKALEARLAEEAKRKADQLEAEKLAAKKKELEREERVKTFLNDCSFFEELVDKITSSPQLYPEKIQEIEALAHKIKIRQGNIDDLTMVQAKAKLNRLKETAERIKLWAAHFLPVLDGNFPIDYNIAPSFSYSLRQTAYLYKNKAANVNGPSLNYRPNGIVDRNWNFLLQIMHEHPFFFAAIERRIGFDLPALNSPRFSDFRKGLHNRIFAIHKTINASKDLKDIIVPGYVLSYKGPAFTGVDLHETKFLKSKSSERIFFEVLFKKEKTAADYQNLNKMLRKPSDHKIKVFSPVGPNPTTIDIGMLSNLFDAYIKEEMPEIYDEVNAPEIDIRILARHKNGGVFQNLVNFLDQVKDNYGFSVKLEVTSSRHSIVSPDATDEENATDFATRRKYYLSEFITPFDDRF